MTGSEFDKLMKDNGYNQTTLAVRWGVVRQTIGSCQNASIPSQTIKTEIGNCESMNEVRIIDVGMCTLSKLKRTIEESRKLSAVYKQSKSKIGSRFVKVYPNLHINIFDKQSVEENLND